MWWYNIVCVSRFKRLNGLFVKLNSRPKIELFVIT